MSDFFQRLEELIDDCVRGGEEIDEIISALELKVMALKEEQDEVK